MTCEVVLCGAVSGCYVDRQVAIVWPNSRYCADRQVGVVCSGRYLVCGYVGDCCVDRLVELLGPVGG